MNETKLTIDRAVSAAVLTEVSGIQADLSCAVDNVFTVVSAITEGICTGERANAALTGATFGLMHLNDKLESLIEDTRIFPVTREVSL